MTKNYCRCVGWDEAPGCDHELRPDYFMQAEALARLVLNHRPKGIRPGLGLAGCSCGWGHEVASHTYHLTAVIELHLREAAHAEVGIVPPPPGQAAG